MSDHDFNTPPDFLDLVRKLDRRGIGLDPCSNEHSLVCAKTEWCEDDDGLPRDWTGHGLVFVNPPHSKSPHNIEPWVVKMVEFWRTREEDDQLAALVPAKTDTAWFHSIIHICPTVCFLQGRPKFWHKGAATGQSGKFASVVLYLGSHPERFDIVFRRLGWIVCQ